MTAPSPHGEVEKATGWQSIETAPKDGTEFIAYSQDLTGSGLNPFVSLCAWHPDAGFCTCELREPTHWTSFHRPPAPAESADDLTIMSQAEAEARGFA